MNAYGLTNEEVEALTEAMKERLDALPLHPHQRLGVPPICKGKDVTAQRLITEQTADLVRRNGIN